MVRRLVLILLVALAVCAPIAFARQSTQAPQIAPGTRVRVGGDVKQPTKIRDVKPVYPEIAQAAKVQGIVILETIIATDGSVSAVRILRGVPLLDEAAVD